MKEWSKLKKTAIISTVAVLGIIGLGSAQPQKSNITNSPTTPVVESSPKVQAQTTQQTAAPVSNPASAPVDTTPAPASTVPVATDCPNGTYVNTDGITVCSPYAAPTAPAGATAQCVDGSYSFSLNHSGTCSHHGGVATWL